MNKSCYSVLLMIIAGIVFILFPPSAVWAATINVTETADDDPNIANGFCSLREAIIAANTDTAIDSCPAGINADTILLPAGNFTLSIGRQPGDSSATGDLDITTAIEIVGVDASSTIIDGGTVDRVFDINAGAYMVDISNVTIRNGVANTSSGDSGKGGGMRFLSGTSTISDSRIEFNITPNEGGGIYNESGSDLTLTQCIISNNRVGPVFASTGGGIHNAGTLSIVGGIIEFNSGEGVGGGIYNQGILTLTDATVRNNIVDTAGGGGGGGGIGNSGAGTVSILTSTIGPNNKTTDGWGGGILNFGTMVITSSTIGPNNRTQDSGGGIYSLGQLSLLNSIVEFNTAESLRGLGGGGVYNFGGELTLTNSSVRGNNAVKNGGGLAITNGMVSINQSTVTRNDADYGGGIYIQVGTLNINNSTISRNDWNGVGIYQDDGLSNLNNVTVTQNGSVSDIGGGIQVIAGTFNIKNSIVAGNTYGSGPGGPFFDCQGAIISGGYNLIQNTTGCNGMVATDVTDQDALLGTLADNDGPTQTNALQTGSPAIDGGNPVACTWDDDNDLATPEVLLTQDQRGITRPLDGNDDGSTACDIGAYELALPPEINVTDSIAPVDDLQISIGDTYVGDSSTAAIVTIANHGHLVLTVSNVQLVGAAHDEFSIDLSAGNDPCGVLTILINGNSSCTFGVIFSPQSAGMKSASLNIIFDDVDETTITIDLNGTGVIRGPFELPPQGGGGGCSLHIGAVYDPLLPAFLLMAGWSLWWHRAVVSPRFKKEKEVSL